MPSIVVTAHGTRDELAVPAQRGPGQLPGGIRGFLWPTEFLMFSDTLVAAPHQHSALQLAVGLDGMPRVRLDGTWHYTPGVLIDTDVAHRSGGRYLPLQDDISSVAFWYQAEPHAPFPKLPDKDYLEVK